MLGGERGRSRGCERQSAGRGGAVRGTGASSSAQPGEGRHFPEDGGEGRRWPPGPRVGQPRRVHRLHPLRAPRGRARPGAACEDEAVVRGEFVRHGVRRHHRRGPGRGVQVRTRRRRQLLPGAQGGGTKSDFGISVAGQLGILRGNTGWRGSSAVPGTALALAPELAAAPCELLGAAEFGACRGTVREGTGLSHGLAGSLLAPRLTPFGLGRSCPGQGRAGGRLDHSSVQAWIDAGVRTEPARKPKSRYKYSSCVTS